MTKRGSIKVKLLSGSVVVFLATSSYMPVNNAQIQKNRKTDNTQKIKQEKLIKHYKEIKEYQVMDERVKLINTFEYCDTIEKIEKRKMELEALQLTEEDKIYPDCPLDASIQHFIYEQSITNGIPFDFLLSLIHVESGGAYNSSGAVGHNAGSEDLGLTQQNTKSSLPVFTKKYQVSSEEAYSLLKDDDYSNICAAFLMCEGIQQAHEEFNPYEFAGCYNGWLGWRNYPTSRNYVNKFQNAYDQIYTEHHEIEDEKTNSEIKYIKKR